MDGSRFLVIRQKHQLGTSMPQGGHPPHHSIISSARMRASFVLQRPQTDFPLPEAFVEGGRRPQ
jgi:hypothetical protein